MVPDAVIMLLVQDNIDLASGTIEKAAMDRAVAEVDEGFAGAYDARRRHRQVCILSSLVLPARSSPDHRSLVRPHPVNRSGTRMRSRRLSLLVCQTRLGSR